VVTLDQLDARIGRLHSGRLAHDANNFMFAAECLGDHTLANISRSTKNDDSHNRMSEQSVCPCEARASR